MRWPRVRLRTMMTAVAFIALVLTVVIQSVRLRQALAREQQYQAAAESRRAQAEAELRQVRAISDEFHAAIADQRRKLQADASKP